DRALVLNNSTLQLNEIASAPGRRGELDPIVLALGRRSRCDARDRAQRGRGMSAALRSTGVDRRSVVILRDLKRVGRLADDEICFAGDNSIRKRASRGKRYRLSV